MKKLLLPFTVIAILFAACKKENNAELSIPATEERPLNTVTLNTDTPNTVYQNTVPLSFTQKLLIEMLSSAYCATCPDAEVKFRAIAAAHPGRVFGVSIHDGDAMEIPLYYSIDSVFAIPYYASGMLNRTPFNGVLVLPKGSWNTNINTCLNKTASCGIKINSSLSGNNATVDVYSAFNTSLTGDYRLTVYLFENSVSGTGPGYDQSNYYNNTVSSPFYQLGNPMVGYQHDFVARKALTPPLGDAIIASQIYRGSCVKRSFSVNITGYDASQLYVVAFINKVTSSNSTHEVMNVQQTKLGLNKNWD